jgi:hypothetical protein
MRPGQLAFWASSALVALGLAGGAASDPRPARPVIHRAGYRVLEADFHAHTTWSDGTLSPFAIVRQADRRGLDVLAVTEHNGTTAGKLARGYAKATGGPLVLVGEEITSARFHMIAVGLERTVSPDVGSVAAVDDVHGQGGVVFAAHPVRHFWPSLVPLRPKLDGAERMHPLAFRDRGTTWSYGSMVEYFDEADPRLAAIGSSDFHAGSILGICRTLVFVSEPGDEASVIAALRAKRTVVIDREGILRGDPELVRALEKEPYTPRTSDYAYRGENGLDRFTRAMGWLGALGLLVLKNRARSDRTEPSGTDPSGAAPHPSDESGADVARPNA